MKQESDNDRPIPFDEFKETVITVIRHTSNRWTQRKVLSQVSKQGIRNELRSEETYQTGMLQIADCSGLTCLLYPIIDLKRGCISDNIEWRMQLQRRFAEPQCFPEQSHHPDTGSLSAAASPR